MMRARSTASRAWICALADEVGALRRALHLDLALLREPRALELAVDVQRLALGLQVLVADLDHRVLLDVVADLLAPLDLLGQPRQALRVERVRRVEVLHRGLVELGQRHRLELQAVLQQVAGDHRAHALDVLPALLVQLLHRHLGGHRAQRVDELALDQLLELVGLHRARAQRLRGRRDRLGRGLDTHVELRHHVDPHPVLGDQRLVATARDLEPQRVHVDRDHVVDDRQHHRAAVHHHLLAPEAGPHERTLLRAAQVEPVEQPDDDRDDDRDDDQAQDEASELGAGHGGGLLDALYRCRVRGAPLRGRCA
jgi:hypothetical protein